MGILAAIWSTDDGRESALALQSMADRAGLYRWMYWAESQDMELV
ncbi:hypothetical protein HMPREF9337_02282 [Cutibacterium acnes HL096PA3]|nr:hypothetical protein [Cutibacterium acnes]ADD99149.1 hypothetical protein HMPREF0675_5185 [Cutibacterium acnes SK137]AEE73323.1 hypothetical protein PAZ_c22040 [Cutibacterium acnes 266]AEW82359.1 hypothetical protein TIA2EST22_10365 [Cutibacterium acnes TypeIA2 P.acn17]AEW84627.1 hypothetical protein TIA2EST36_10345 [Cutibacterium acnes TypeIA2 P.acn31]AFU41902.1 hypothetical protein PAC1_10810 [Cutibacterium acnes C1]AGJ80819.1 hypothetical protein PAGK_2021 [Cutibacterium acnes HL096PA1]